MTSPSGLSRPFQITITRHEQTPSGSFRPGALVQITPALRTSGLLLVLSGEQLQSLLLVLTFLHPNGDVQPTLLQLAKALHLSPRQTRARMRRLVGFVWQGEPLLHELRRDSGLHAFAPSPHLVQIHQAASETPMSMQTPSSDPANGIAGQRAAIVARTHDRYARPRAEVERDIALANGWSWPFQTLGQVREELRRKAHAASGSEVPEAVLSSVNSTLPTNTTPMNASSRPSTTSENEPVHDTALSPTLEALRLELIAWGVTPDMAERLLATHDPQHIRQQLDWLPFRHANHPARLLAAAIEQDYAAPLAARLSQATTKPATALQEAMSTLDVPPPPEAEPGDETSDLTKDGLEPPTNLPLL